MKRVEENIALTDALKPGLHRVQSRLNSSRGLSVDQALETNSPILEVDIKLSERVKVTLEKTNIH